MWHECATPPCGWRLLRDGGCVGGVEALAQHAQRAAVKLGDAGLGDAELPSDRGELDTVEVVLRHDHLFAVGKPVERVDELLAPLGGEQVGSRDRTPAVGELVCVRGGITVAATAVEAD